MVWEKNTSIRENLSTLKSKLSTPRQWTVETPYLYSLTVKFGNDVVRRQYGGGRDLTITSDSLFSASTLHYDLSELDEGAKRHQRHFHDLRKSRFTNLFIDQRQSGVGGVDSWSPKAMPF